MSIRATCDQCGDVSIENEQLTVRLCVDNNTATYVFKCPSCELPVVRDVHRQVRDLLITSGCNVEPWFLPEELFEQKHGAPISADDLLDFHQAMNR